MAKPIRVGVTRGGPSNEYEVSLATGASVLAALRKKLDDRYLAHDILIDRSKNWHLDGIPVSPHDLVHRVDVVFNALHGAYGEDGTVQTIFETHRIPFTGSGSLSSAMSMNKVISKKVFADHGLRIPLGREVGSDRIGNDEPALLRELFQSLILPAVVKPVSGGSSVGTSVVFDYQQLSEALRSAAVHGDSVLIEEFIPGIEATCGVVEGFRGQEIYALPPIEIRSLTKFFDYEAKYQGKSQEIVPATFSEKIKQAIETASKKIHKALGLRHYSRSDFIIHPRRGIYVLEVNTLPGLTSESLVPKALRAVGSDVHELVDHLIGLARKERKGN